MLFLVLSDSELYISVLLVRPNMTFGDMTLLTKSIMQYVLTFHMTNQRIVRNTWQEKHFW